MGWMTKTALWFEQRLKIRRLFEATAGHKVPPSADSWFYVFGSGTLVAFILQVITGVCLALVYIPSADRAWSVLQYLNHEQYLGWFLRALHFWGSNFMVGVMTLHMIATFLLGAYKFPRELTWVFGCLLFICTLGMAFTGQVLRFDQDAYWGLGIGAAIMGRVPFIGAQLVHLMLGGPIIASATLSRFFTLHVFVIPGLILALVSVHLRLVLTKGISEYPKPGEIVRKETYEHRYEQAIAREGVPFFPNLIGKDLIFSSFLMAAILACALVFGPSGPSGPPDPAMIETAPRPDFFFLSLYSVLALLPPYTETFLLLTAPIVGIGLLIALPFIAGTGERSPRVRPVSVLVLIFSLLVLGSLAYVGTYAPWSPHMDAWSSVPTPVQYLQGRSPVEIQGAILIQAKQCRNCHSLGGQGGLRGPALDGVANLLTHGELIRQVIQGSGNMPAYGQNLSPAEVTQLVAFMETLRSPGEPAARNAATPK